MARAYLSIASLTELAFLGNGCFAEVGRCSPDGDAGRVVRVFEIISF
jgi:hypothetical protein